ncbi:MAG: hypothetical protein OEW32_09300 [Nitrospira sp.]|nr:hypothetical protein [Nitrospira sp.]
MPGLWWFSQKNFCRRKGHRLNRWTGWVVMYHPSWVRVGQGLQLVLEIFSVSLIRCQREALSTALK